MNDVGWRVDEGPDWLSRSCGKKLAVEDVRGRIRGLTCRWSKSRGLLVDVENVGLRARALIGRVGVVSSKQLWKI